MTAPMPNTAFETENRTAVVIRSQSLIVMLDWAKKTAPHVEASVRQELQLPEPTQGLLKEITVPMSTYRRTTELLAERLGDDSFGLHAALESPRGSFGILEYAARGAPDVCQALTRTVRYWPLLSDVIQLDFQVAHVRLDASTGNRSAGGALTHRINGESQCLGRHGNEFTAAVLIRYLREITGHEVRPVRLEFAHPRPANTSEIERFFGTSDLQFDCGHNRLFLDDQTLAMAVPASDEKLLPWLDGYADSLLPPSESEKGESFPGLRRHIRTCLQEGAPPTVAEIARRLRVSSRTLQRRLGDASTSFYASLEKVRYELAEGYLRDPKLSIYEVALRIGYANERGFERAFMKWHGMTPRAYRRKLPGFPTRGGAVPPAAASNDTTSAAALESQTTLRAMPGAGASLTGVASSSN